MLNSFFPGYFITSMEPKTQTGYSSDPISKMNCLVSVFAVPNLWELPSEDVRWSDQSLSSGVRVPLIDLIEALPLQRYSSSLYCFYLAYLSFLTYYPPFFLPSQVICKPPMTPLTLSKNTLIPAILEVRFDFPRTFLSVNRWPFAEGIPTQSNLSK